MIHAPDATSLDYELALLMDNDSKQPFTNLLHISTSTITYLCMHLLNKIVVFPNIDHVNSKDFILEQ